jgi:hypothetical protein
LEGISRRIYSPLPCGAPRRAQSTAPSAPPPTTSVCSCENRRQTAAIHEQPLLRQRILGSGVLNAASQPHTNIEFGGAGARLGGGSVAAIAPVCEHRGDRKPAQARALHVPAWEVPVVLHGQSWRTETAAQGSVLPESSCSQADNAQMPLAYRGQSVFSRRKPLGPPGNHPSILARVTDRDRALLSMIEQAILDDSVTTTSILQKCIILGGRSGSTTLRDWAAKELRGYGPDDEVPPYRRIAAPIYIDGQVGPSLFQGRAIGVEDLPDVVQEWGIGNEFSLRQGLGELEALARSGDDSVRFGSRSSSLIVKMMNRRLSEFETVFNVYWKVTPQTIQGVVEQARTSVAKLVGELLAMLPSDGDTPSNRTVIPLQSRPLTRRFNTSSAASGTRSTSRRARPRVAEGAW